MSKLVKKFNSVSDFLNDGLKALKPLEGEEIFEALAEVAPCYSPFA